MCRSIVQVGGYIPSRVDKDGFAMLREYEQMAGPGESEPWFSVTTTVISVICEAVQVVCPIGNDSVSIPRFLGKDGRSAASVLTSEDRKPSQYITSGIVFNEDLLGKRLL